MPYTKNKTKTRYSFNVIPYRYYVKRNGAWQLSSLGQWSTTDRRSQSQSYLYREWNQTVGWRTFLQSEHYLKTLEMADRRRSSLQKTTSFVAEDIWGTERYEVMDASADVFYPFEVAASQWNNFDFSGLTADAKVKCLAKVRDMKVNLPVFFGEGRQTVRMLTDTARTLYKSYRAFRRGRFKQAADILGITKPSGTAANHWLAYQYGWKPLLSDALGFAKLAFDHLEMGGRKPRMTVTAKNSVTQHDKYSVTGVGIAGLQGNFVAEGDITVTSKAGLLVELDYSPSALAAQLGLGLTDPLLLAWELTPFSFVFDWFIDVGGYLESCSALQGWTVLDGWDTRERHGTYVARWVFAYPNFKVTEGLMPSGAFQDRSFSRRPWTGVPPFVVFRSPVSALGADRLKTSAALFRQRTMGDRNGSYRP